VVLFVVVPSHSCQLLLFPKHFKVLSSNNVHVEYSDLNIVCIFEIQATTTGVELAVVVPSHNSQAQLFPQHFAVLSSRSTQVPCTEEYTAAILLLSQLTVIGVLLSVVVPSHNFQ
jgi:hypothetical protein